MSEVLLTASIRRLPDGQYEINVNGVIHTFQRLYEAFWMLKEAADQQARKLREQDR